LPVVSCQLPVKNKRAVRLLYSPVTDGYQRFIGNLSFPPGN